MNETTTKPNRRWRVGAVLTVAGSVTLLGLVASPAAASDTFLADGAGRGPTAEVAVRSALGDAQTTAQSVGFFGECTIVGEPRIIETLDDPNFGHVFRAGVVASCER